MATPQQSGTNTGSASTSAGDAGATGSSTRGAQGGQGSQGSQGQGAQTQGAQSQGSSAAGQGASGAGGVESERPIPRSGEGTTGRQQQSRAPARQQGGGRAAAGRQGGLLRRGLAVSPWELLRQMSMEMDQLVNTVSGAGNTNAMRSTQPNLSRQGAGAPALAGAIAAPLVPQIDVIQRPDALVVRADLPGLKADEIDVSVEDGMLVISGERREQHEDDQGGVRRSEVVYGTFYRTIPLPDGADEDSVVAAFNNGVLEIIVPVAEREQARRVQVRG